MPRRSSAQPATHTPETLRDDGWRAFQAARYDTAVQIWEALPTRDPALKAALAEAYFRAAVAFRKATSEQTRGSYLERALELCPGDPTYRYHLAMHHHRTGNLAAARTLYEQLVADHAPWAGLPELLALLALQQDPHTDLALLPGSTPALCARLAPVQSLLVGSPPAIATPANGAAPLWAALARVAAHHPNAYASLAALELAPQLVGLQHYYLGVAALQQQEYELALHHWTQIPADDRFSLPGLPTNLVHVLVQQLGSLHAQQQLDTAGQLALHVSRLNLAHATLDTLLVETLDAAAHHAAQQQQWDDAITYWTAARTIIARRSTLGSPRTLLHNLALAHEARAALRPAGAAASDWLAAAELWRTMARTRPRSTNAPTAGYDAAAWTWIRRRAITCYQHANATQQAVDVYRQLVRANPTNTEVRMELVDALRVNDQDGAAINELERILAIDPDHIEALLQLAQYDLEDYGWRPDWQHLQRLFALNPADELHRRRIVQLTVQKTYAMQRIGYSEEALHLLQQGQQFEPQSYLFPLLIARIQIDQHRYDLARTLLQRALDLSTTHHYAYVAVIECWVVMDDLQRAHEIWQHAEQLLDEPQRVAFYMDLGHMLIAHSQPPIPFQMHSSYAHGISPHPELLELARRAFAAARALRPNNALLLLKVASELVPVDTELALEYAHAADALAPDDPSTMIMIGLLLGLRNADREARQILRRAEKLAREQHAPDLARYAAQIRAQIGTGMLRVSVQMALFSDFADDDDEFDADLPDF